MCIRDSHAWLSMRDKPRFTAVPGADDDVDDDLIDYRDEQQQQRRFAASLAGPVGAKLRFRDI